MLSLLMTTINRNGIKESFGLLSNYFWLLTAIIHLFVKTVTMVCVSIARLVLPAPEKSVEGKVVLITDAGMGLGRQLALKFAERGGRIVLLDINQENNEKVAEEIRKMGGTACALPCDVLREEQVKLVVKTVQREVGDISILINSTTPEITKFLSAQIGASVNDDCPRVWTVHRFMPEQGQELIVPSIIGLMANPSITNYRFPHLMPISRMSKTADIIVDAVLRNKEMVIIPSKDCLHIFYSS